MNYIINSCVKKNVAPYLHELVCSSGNTSLTAFLPISFIYDWFQAYVEQTLNVAY